MFKVYSSNTNVINFNFKIEAYVFLDVKDYSGIRLYVTQNYRPIEAGVLTVLKFLQYE